MLVKDIMTRRLITAGPDTTVAELARLMAENRIGGIPIVNSDGVLVGVVTERDLLRRAEIGTEEKPSWWLRLLLGEDALARDFTRSHGRHAKDVMSNWPITIEPDQPLVKAATAMAERDVARLIVVENGRPIGILARSDLVRAIASAPNPVSVADDADLQARILDSLAAAGLSPHAITVVVSDGKVHLWGAVPTAAVRDAVRAAAEEIAGADNIEDHLFIAAAVTWE